MTYKVSMKQVALVTAPTVEPVSLAEMKAHCRVDTSDDDTVLYGIIVAARKHVEKLLGKSLVQRTYRADVEGFASRYQLPMPPLSSLTSVKYYTDDSPQVLTTLDSSFYRADLGRAQIYIDADAGNIPNHASRHDAVQITFVAGAEPTTDSPQDLTGNIDRDIIAAIKLQAADLYENRETNTQLRMQTLPTTMNLLSLNREYQ